MSLGIDLNRRFHSFDCINPDSCNDTRDRVYVGIGGNFLVFRRNLARGWASRGRSSRGADLRNLVAELECGIDQAVLEILHAVIISRSDCLIATSWVQLAEVSAQDVAWALSRH